MRDVVITTGPFGLFEHLYDPELDRVDGLADYPAIRIAEKALRDPSREEYHRDPAAEYAFLQTLLAPLLQRQPALYGFRDVERAAGHALGLLLRSQNKIRWTSMKYGRFDDDLILCELRDFHEDLDFLRECYPPKGGDVFFPLTKQPFDVFEIFWRRRARAAPKAERDPFQRDLLAFAKESQALLCIDPDGTILLLRRPDYLDDDDVLRRLEQASLKARWSLTRAPGLFG